MHPEPPSPALIPPSHRSEELQGSRLLRDAAAAETTRTGDFDTDSLGTGQGWGVLQTRRDLGGQGDGFGLISKCERVWRWIEASSKEETFRVWIGVPFKSGRVLGWTGMS